MAKQIIQLGSAVNDGTGDPLRTAFGKVNSNFTELYDNISSLSVVATSGSYTDLSNKPNLFSGSYDDLSNKPSLFSGSYNDLSDKPSLFSGSYNDLSNKPTIPSLTGYATETYVGQQISNLINSAPGTLDTLGEIATALQSDEGAISSLTSAISSKIGLTALSVTTASASGSGSLAYNNTSGVFTFTPASRVLDTTAVTYTAPGKTWSVPTTNVNSTLNTVTLTNHGLSNGDAVIYYSGGGSPIAPLTNGTTYYIRVYDANNVYLYDTSAHAIATASTTGLRDLGATGNNAQYFTTFGVGLPVNINFDGTANQVFVVTQSTAGNIIANLIASLSNNQSMMYRFIIAGGATNYTFNVTSVNGSAVTGITPTITANINNVFNVLLVRLNNTYTIYQS